MSELQQCQFGNEFAPWQTGAAFSSYWSYTFVNNSIFYAMIPAYYRPFMQRMVQKWGWWNDGWVPYFHHADKGIMSTRLASSLVQKIARKVIGSRLMFKNAGKQKDCTGSNSSRVSICNWADDTNFDKAVKLAAKYATGLGTSLLKLNKDDKGELWAEAVRFDRFLPSVDASTGKLREVRCFLMSNVDYGKGGPDSAEFVQVWNLVEHRYFGDYRSLDGKEYKNVPLVKYSVYRTTGSISQGSFSLYNADRGENVRWTRLPPNVQSAIKGSYGELFLDVPRLLPFADSLGAELMTWTEGVLGFPQLPFGESVLENIMSQLMLYDYMHSAMGTDMYAGRARILLPRGIEGVHNKQGISPNWDAGLDEMMYVKVPYVNPEDQKPEVVQFALRADEWKTIRNTLIESMAVNIGLSPSTLAAFLNDSSARTAREVSTEENETAGYVADTRAIIETPINRIIDLVRLYKALPDKVVVRWSQSGLSNAYITTEMMTQQYSAGLISRQDAIANLNPDDDEDQIIAKSNRAAEDWKSRQFGAAPFGDDEVGGGYFGEDNKNDDTAVNDDKAGTKPSNADNRRYEKSDNASAAG